MRHLLVILLAGCAVSRAAADDPFFPYPTTEGMYNGLMVIRRGDTTTWYLGGGLIDRRVKTTVATPQGPVVTKFTVPSLLHSPVAYPYPGLPQPAPAELQMNLPDPFSQVYIEGKKVPGLGKTRLLQTPCLKVGRNYPLNLRVASIIGDNIFVEDKVISLRAGAKLSVNFESTTALKVPLSQVIPRMLPADGGSVLPQPSEVR